MSMITCLIKEMEQAAGSRSGEKANGTSDTIGPNEQSHPSQRRAKEIAVDDCEQGNDPDSLWFRKRKRSDNSRTCCC